MPNYSGAQWDVVVPHGQTFRRRLQLGQKCAATDPGAVLAPTGDKRTYYQVANLTGATAIRWRMWSDHDDDQVLKEFTLTSGLSIVAPATGGLLDIVLADTVVNQLPLVNDGRHAITVTFADGPKTYVVGGLRVVREGVAL